MKPEIVADPSAFERVKAKVGKPAAQVWSFLQNQEARPNAKSMTQVDEIIVGTGMERESVLDAIISLARGKLITKITPDGRVAA